MPEQIDLRFDGATYDALHDSARLARLLLRVYTFMRDGEWRTLAAIAEATGGSEASVSARLRDLRKYRFGAYVVERRRVTPAERGLFEYRLDAREDRHV
jgi:DNA-binding transcriptional regulator GbsR (MarR family)